MKLREIAFYLSKRGTYQIRRTIYQKMRAITQRTQRSTKDTKKLQILENRVKSFVKLREPFVKLCVIAVSPQATTGG